MPANGWRQFPRANRRWPGARRACGITDSSFRLYAAVWSMDAEGCGTSRNGNMLTAEVLNETVVELASRPGHEKVRALLYRLLVDGLGAASREIDFEKPVPEVNGRIDALLGRTVFELKSDLRRERRDAEKRAGAIPCRAPGRHRRTLCRPRHGRLRIPRLLSQERRSRDRGPLPDRPGGTPRASGLASGRGRDRRRPAARS